MNRKRTALLLVVILVLLCGCGKKTDGATVTKESPVSTEKESSKAADNQDSEEENAVKEYDHNLICDRWADSGAFKMYTSDEEFFDFYFDYSIPQIVDDTKDAKEINDSIESLFGDMHEIMQKASKEGEMTAEEFDSTGWSQTKYDCYWNDSIASIVIYSTGYYDSNTNYNIYNYDFETGKQLNNKDIFALKGITAEQFVENMRRAAVYSLDTEIQQFFEYNMPLTEDELWYADVVDEDVQHMYGDYLMARAKTIHMDNMNENLPIYLDEHGEMKVVTQLYNMGMYGEVTNVLSPKEWVNNDVKASSGDLLDVVSKNDGIYLTIYKNDWSEAMHEEYPTFDYAKEYKIDGLYKNYTAARISWVGNGNQPYILLLSDDGTISYVDVWEGIASEYFCAVEPLWGLENIKSFDDNSEYRIAAVNNKGISIDVEDALYMMLSCKYIDFEKNLLKMDDLSRYSATVKHKTSGQDIEYEEMIGFTDDKYHMFVRETYKTDDYEGGSQLGYLTFNGMNENGMVFYFSLVGEEGELRGTMAINLYSFWEEDCDDYIDGADATWLGGFDIFESEGKKVILKSSVG